MSVDQLGYLNLGAPTRNPFNYEKFEQIARDNTTAWLTLAEIRQQLNLFDDTSQDTYLSSLELATRQAIEDLVGQKDQFSTTQCCGTSAPQGAQDQQVGQPQKRGQIDPRNVGRDFPKIKHPEVGQVSRHVDQRADQHESGFLHGDRIKTGD